MTAVAKVLTLAHHGAPTPTAAPVAAGVTVPAEKTGAPGAMDIVLAKVTPPATAADGVTVPVTVPVIVLEVAKYGHK